MNRFALPSALLLAASVAVACEEVRTPTEATNLTPRLAKLAKPGGGGDGSISSECGGRTGLRDSRVRLDWSATDAISGDVGGDVFEGDQNGVAAKIFYHDAGCSRSGDLTFDADMNAKRHKRHLTFHFPTNRPAGVSATETAAPFVNFRAIQFLGSDIGTTGVIDGRDAKVEAKNPDAPRSWEFPPASADRPDYPTFRGTTAAGPLRFNFMEITGCEALEYAAIRLTRTAGIDGFQATGTTLSDGTPLGQWSDALEHLGAWTVESLETSNNGVAGHWAQCYESQGGDLVPIGDPMHMPFAVTLTEVR